ncbi:glycine cleavage system aminomethyltransferase GcvT [Burkholderiaceae bacterium FT117]|uniref:glycine cleavage system aminomethyltransferase GcvT n=1 Tax=Zeimonas sediminis TaxID=2944268 RepID=UPI00234302DD|nr:glycine cleavage system aminomethyltransferase GcvT [Zeimonas sediminis]MCM5570634.1 glycine cleavage system aminomethyltransferase GcvT [Zeimonas sediminis]
MTETRRVPLDAMHRAAGAKMGPFAGWEMPIQYPAGLKAEHLHTREAASLFDVSHMGQLRVVAADGRASTLYAQLEAALPVDFEGWQSGQQKYSYLLNDTGGIEDDLMLVHLTDGSQAEVRIVVNAGNRDADLKWFHDHCPKLRFEWIPAALVALQGPQAEQALAALDPEAATLRFMQSATLHLLGAACFTTRSGYTGEDGYEISIPLDKAEAVAGRLLEIDEVRWAGLGARDTLRLEAGLPLHGNDIGPQTSPVEAGLSFAIPKSRRAGGLKAGGFPGADTILRQFAEGPRRRLVGLVSHDPVPIRAHAAIVDARDRQVGEVSSGTVSPTLGHPVMLAWIERQALEHEATEPLRAVVRDKRLAVQVTGLPFVPKRYKR